MRVRTARIAIQQTFFLLACRFGITQDPTHETLLLLGASLSLIQGTRSYSHREHSYCPKLDKWPTHFEGAALHPIAGTEFEKALTTTFLTNIATFRSAGRQVILRRVTRGTRRLLASENSLRQMHFQITKRQIDSEGWLTYYASRNEQTFHVREQITNGSKTWHSPSTWFWHATVYPKSGPWLVTTVFTPIQVTLS